MPLDLRTIIFCNVVVTFSVAMALLYYRLTQKTYAGFDHWTAGTWCLGLGYLLLFARGQFLPTWLSIVAVNLLVSLGAVTRLDGVLRFVRERRLFGAAYAVAALVTATSAYLSLVTDHLAARTVIISVIVAAVSLAIAGVCLAGEERRNRSCLAFGILHVFYAVLFGVRAVVWMVAPPTSLFDSGPNSVMSFASTMVVEVAIGVSYFMMNANRVEGELVSSTETIRRTLAELQQSLSEVRMLTGLLPICAYCKRVRDDAGYWQQVESYISAHSRAVFSHGICPECLSEHYPEEAGPLREPSAPPGQA